MPYSVTQDQAVEAINKELSTLTPPSQILSLDTGEMSDTNWSCNNFAPAILERVCVLTNSSYQSTQYQQGAALPTFANGNFVNISMLGDPSDLNHNFNILVSGETTYLIQAFLDHQVNIVRSFANADFNTQWQNLSGNVGWTAAYEALFGIAPSAVLPAPPQNTWLQNQWVSI